MQLRRDKVFLKPTLLYDIPILIPILYCVSKTNVALAAHRFFSDCPIVRIIMDALGHRNTLPLFMFIVYIAEALPIINFDFS